MLDEIDVNRVIEMAWEDRTPFEVIQSEFNLTHGELIEIMRNNLKTRSFKLWRKRAKGQSIKHRKKFEESRKEIRRKINKNDYI